MAGRYVHTGAVKDGQWVEEDVWVEYTGEEYREIIREQLVEKQSALRRTDDAVLEELEAAFGATTLTGLLSTIVTSGTRLKTVLAERVQLRKEIRELEEEQAMPTGQWR